MSENESYSTTGVPQKVPDATAADAPAERPLRNDACLPGFESIVAERPSATASFSERNKPSAGDEAADGKVGNVPQGPRFAKTILCAACAACAGIAVVAAHKLIKPRIVRQEVVHEISAESEDVPLALLPETADPELWPVVSEMSGMIDGKPVFFKHGIAMTKDVDFKVCLDFCRNGNDIYVRVRGNGFWVVKVTPEGKIEKAYRASRNGKSLKELFGQ